jgi:hypothetical protein
MDDGVLPAANENVRWFDGSFEDSGWGVGDGAGYGAALELPRKGSAGIKLRQMVQQRQDEPQWICGVAAIAAGSRWYMVMIVADLYVWSS